MILQAWFEMAAIRPLHQGQTLIANCASASMAIATLLERLVNSENDKGNKNG